MKQHIEQTEGLIKKIDSILTDKKANIEYGDKFQQLQQNVQKINDWARDIKRRLDNSQFSEDQEIVQTMNRLIFTCEDIQEYIKIDEVIEISLPKLKESLTNVKTAQEQSLNQASYSDIMDKILLIEEEYQNNNMKFDAEKAVKQLSKLEQLQILQDGSAESKQLILIITNHKKEMGVTAVSDKQYEQDIKPNEQLDALLSRLETSIDSALNGALDLDGSQTSYRPEFENLCERVNIIIRDFIDAEGSLYDSTNLSNLYNEATKLTSQFKISYNEQQQKLNQNNEKQNLNQSIQNLTRISEEVSQKILPVTTVESQIDLQQEHFKKFEGLAENMPASVFEESYKFLYQHYGDNLNQAATLHQQGLISEELFKKCQHSYQLIANLYENAKQYGIELQ